MMTVAYKKEMKTVVSAEGGILKVLTYFSIFQYPLTKEEIKKFLQTDVSITCFENSLERLEEEGSIFKMDDFYSPANDISWAIKRRQGNHRAAVLLPKAMKIGQFLFKFPYVKGVAVSGSLSKMYADEKADIDFFIITKANRLWIARTFMHLYKKLTFLTGRQHFYCMNYYLGENVLKLEDQNIYTAIEAATLLPVCGDSMHDFFTANSWVSEWFADHDINKTNTQSVQKRSWVKRIIERVLNGKAGDRFDNYLMKMTTRRWQKKKQQGKRNDEGEEMDLITGKHFAKSNPGMFQEKLLTVYNEKLNELKKQYPAYFTTSFEE